MARIFLPERRSSQGNFDPPASASIGTSDTLWSTPAECYVAWLSEGIPPLGADASVGVGLTPMQAMEVVVAVADALLVVGALPGRSFLLRQLPSTRDSVWRSGLTRHYVSRVRDKFVDPSTDQNLVALGIRLPLRRATVMIEWMTMNRGMVLFEFYASPDIMGEYWPVSTRSFRVRATDDLGGEHEAASATHWRGHRGEGWGDMLLWPPIDAKVRHLRLHVDTLWESVCADIELPA